MGDAAPAMSQSSILKPVSDAHLLVNKALLIVERSAVEVHVVVLTEAASIEIEQVLLNHCCPSIMIDTNFKVSAYTSSASRRSCRVPLASPPRTSPPTPSHRRCALEHPQLPAREPLEEEEGQRRDPPNVEHQRDRIKVLPNCVMRRSRWR